jgi:hypothetical protein
MARRERLIEAIQKSWARDAARYPDIHWDGSSLEIDMAEHAFEAAAADYLAGKIELADLKPLFQARTEAYR